MKPSFTHAGQLKEKRTVGGVYWQLGVALITLGGEVQTHCNEQGKRL
jgi:hypothetical protein